MGTTTKIWEDLEHYPDCILFSWIEDGQETVTVALKKPCKLQEAEKRAIAALEWILPF